MWGIIDESGSKVTGKGPIVIPSLPIDVEGSCRMGTYC